MRALAGFLLAMSLDHCSVRLTDASVSAVALADGAGCEAGVDRSVSGGLDTIDTESGAKKGKRGTRAKKSSVTTHLVEGG